MTYAPPRDSLEWCPHCWANLQGPPVPPEWRPAIEARPNPNTNYHYSRKLFIYAPGPDGRVTGMFKCPECLRTWSREQDVSLPPWWKPGAVRNPPQEPPLVVGRFTPRPDDGTRTEMNPEAAALMRDFQEALARDVVAGAGVPSPTDATAPRQVRAYDERILGNAELPSMTWVRWSGQHILPSPAYTLHIGDIVT